MAAFDQMQQAPLLDGEVPVPTAPDQATDDKSSCGVWRQMSSHLRQPVVVRGRDLLELGLIGVGVVTLSVLFIWATITDRVGIEVIIALIAVLALSVFTVSHTLSSQRRLLSLQESARESAAKTILATEILMEYLREFTLRNQEIITQVAEAQKMRVVEELRRSVSAFGPAVADQRLRRGLEQLDEMIERKIMEIATGVAFPVPHLERFDQALRHIQEPDRTLTCPGCGARQAHLQRIDSRKGIQYTCLQCAHEFSLGITVMLEKHS
jgi:hypothetical protein